MLTQLKILEQIQHKQAIVNVYEDDELVQRDGFSFQYIQVDHEKINFFKNGEVVYSLDITNTQQFRERKEFHDYYSLYKGKNRIDLYFP